MTWSGYVEDGDINIIDNMIKLRNTSNGEVGHQSNDCKCEAQHNKYLPFNVE